jgi:hypothetical protein
MAITTAHDRHTHIPVPAAPGDAAGQSNVAGAEDAVVWDIGDAQCIGAARQRGHTCVGRLSREAILSSP